MKSSLFLIFAFLVLRSLCQDVLIPDDILAPVKDKDNSTDYVYEDNEKPDLEIENQYGTSETEDGPPPDCLIKAEPSEQVKTGNCIVENPLEVHIECPSGQFRNGSSCFPLPTTTTKRPTPPPVPLPVIVNTTVFQPEKEETFECPIGQNLVGNTCVSANTGECPEGYQWKNDRCVKITTECALNFEMDESGRCVQKQICPRGHKWDNGRCVQPEPDCPSGYRWNGFRCVIIEVRCPLGTVLKGHECVTEEILCPIDQRLVGEKCVKPIECPRGMVLTPEGLCKSVFEKCPSETLFVNGTCVKTEVFCQSGYHKVGDQCYPDRIPVTSTSNPNQCEDGFVFMNGYCRPIFTTTDKPRLTLLCREGFRLYRGLCYKCESKKDPPSDPPPMPEDTTTTERGETTTRSTTTKKPYTRPTTTSYRPPTYRPPTAPPTYRPPTAPPTFRPPTPYDCPYGFILQNNLCYRCQPGYKLCNLKCIRNSAKCCEETSKCNKVQVNVNLKFENGGFKIINQVEPVLNNITNFNEVTHPVTINKVNENNIYIYSDVQCADGSIRSVVVKNNKTINGCVDVETSNNGSNERDRENSVEGDDEDCCEVVTPRKCKQRSDTRWMCTHRFYQHCGKACIAKRVYLKPSKTSYINEVLTIVPSVDSSADSKPCFGRACPAIGNYS